MAQHVKDRPAYIDELSNGRIKLLQYNGSTSKALFRDENTNLEFSYTYAACVMRLKDNPNHRFTGKPLKTSEEDQKARILELSNGKITLVKYTGPHSVCTFKYTDTDREFRYNFGTATTRLKENPDYVFTGVVKSNTFGEHAKDINRLSEGRYKLISASSVKDSCQLLDVSDDIIVTTLLEHAKKALTINSNYKFTGKPNSFSFDERRSEILELSNGKVDLLTYNGSASFCTFKYLDTDETLSYYFNSFRTELKKNPNYRFHSNNSMLEVAIQTILDSLGITYIIGKAVPGGSYRPDLLLPDHNVIIECDGIYWHSEGVLGSKGVNGKTYHVEKLKAYEDLGYTALFFREDEINNSLPLVESIIKNKLGLSTKLYARKCTLSVGTSDFFEENHLMGKGSGKIFTLTYNNEVVAAMQVKWKKKGEILDISRFCTKLNTSVVGGFSKLLKAVEKEYNPPVITNFVDRRYGSGKHLEKLGFTKETCYPSFRWVDTNTRQTYGRMRYPNGSGLDYGLVRLWDCGQAKWVKYL